MVLNCWQGSGPCVRGSRRSFPAGGWTARGQRLTLRRCDSSENPAQREKLGGPSRKCFENVRPTNTCLTERKMASVCVIDDDSELNEALCTILSAQGHSARSFFRLSDLDLYRDHTDLVFLDLQLPDGSGLDAIPRL